MAADDHNILQLKRGRTRARCPEKCDRNSGDSAPQPHSRTGDQRNPAATVG
jgi:hypothetical protein